MKPDQYYPDGYRGGGELPDDQWLDRIVWPEDPPQDGLLIIFNGGDNVPRLGGYSTEAEHEQHHKEFAEDRAFVITEDNLTGRKTGPPRTS